MRSVVCKTACEGLTPSRLSTDHDGLVTLDSLIRSPHRVRFTGDPRAARDMRARVADAIRSSFLTRRWLSSDNTCSTSRTRQVRSLRAARPTSILLSIVQRRDHSPRKGEMKVRILLLRPNADVAQLAEVPVSETGCCGFESLLRHHFKDSSLAKPQFAHLERVR